MKISWKNVMKVKLLFMPLMFVFFLFQGTAMAATGDVIDSFNFSSAVCANVASAILIDVDGDSNNETMVIFLTITGVASPGDEVPPPVTEDPPQGKWYSFSPDDTSCQGTEPWDRARVLIRFVDMLADGFIPEDWRTWTYKGIETVSIKTWYDPNDPCVATAMPPSVQAYGEVNQTGMITGTSTTEGDWESHVFSDQNGIEELVVSSDYCQNHLDELVLDDVPLSYPPHSCDTADYWVIGVFEVLDAIDKWVEGGNCGDLTVGVFDVLDLIDFWVFGSYCWDTTSEAYKTGIHNEFGECL